MSISPSILEYLEFNSYSFSILYESDWKKTVVLRLTKNDESFILKGISEESPPEIISSFQKEKSFYEKNITSLIPDLIFANNEMFIIRFFGKMTLREFCLKQKITPEFSSKFYTFISDCEEFFSSIQNEGQPDFSNAYLNLSSLGTSGPIQTKSMRVSKLRLFIQRVHTWFLKKKLKRIIEKSSFDRRPGTSHGDFHYNNILVDENFDFKLIDFEKYNDQSYFEFDLIYLIIMLSRINQELNFKTDLNIELQKICERDYKWKEVINIYNKAILFNKRFNY